MEDCSKTPFVMLQFSLECNEQCCPGRELQKRPWLVLNVEGYNRSCGLVYVSIK